MLNCQQASQLVSQSLDRRLRWNERFALRLHLIICKYCKRFSQQIQALRVAFKQHVTIIENDAQITLSASAKNNITNLIKDN